MIWPFLTPFPEGAKMKSVGKKKNIQKLTVKKMTLRDLDGSQLEGAGAWHRSLLLANRDPGDRM